MDETLLETYATPIDDEKPEFDEYIEFCNVMTSEFSTVFLPLDRQSLSLLTIHFLQTIELSAEDPQYYSCLVTELSQEQRSGLDDIIKEAERKKAHYVSKTIEEQGGSYSTRDWSE